MFRQQITLWKWAKPSKVFQPVENPFWTRRGITFATHNKVVYAGLNPLDWMWKKSVDGVLHKIVLTKDQVRLCVVAEGSFRPSDEEMDQFIESRGIPDLGSHWEYVDEHYEQSFIPFIEYSGGMNLPEVLVPFAVRGKVVTYSKLLIAYFKLKNWINDII